jgi:heme/copper-type cytochrome/quinol oxidase subunit 2
MADVTTHTRELKDLHLWFEFTLWFVFFLYNLHLWFFHHRNERRPHTLKKQNVVTSKSLSHMKTRKPCVMILLFSYFQIAKWYTCTNKKTNVGPFMLASKSQNHGKTRRQNKDTRRGIQVQQLLMLVGLQNWPIVISFRCTSIY